jgi:hypothetical protein
VSDQGEVYAAFIENELKVERDRRTALDARGLAIVTTSGTLTTLLVAVGARSSADGRVSRCRTSRCRRSW